MGKIQSLECINKLSPPHIKNKKQTQKTTCTDTGNKCYFAWGVWYQ